MIKIVSTIERGLRTDISFPIKLVETSLKINFPHRYEIYRKQGIQQLKMPSNHHQWGKNRSSH